MMTIKCEKCKGNRIHQYSQIRRKFVCTCCSAGRGALDAGDKLGGRFRT